MDSPARPALRWAIPLGVATATFLTFLPALGGSWLNWDDDVNFVDNVHYRGLGSAQLGWMFTDFTGHYMPLTWLTLGLDYELWGMDAGGYHLSSLLLQAANAALCYFFLLALLRRWTGGGGASELSLGACAALGALLWSVHPLRVESVAWITERRDLVAGLFTFPSLLAYLKALPAGNAGPVDRRWMAASVALFALSMLGKAIGMTLPLALLVMDAFPLGRLAADASGRRPWKPILLEKLPFLAVMIAGVAMTAIGQARAAAIQEANSFGPANFLVQPGWRAVFYLIKVLLPLGLSPLYPFHADADPWAITLLAAAAAAAGITLLAWRYRRAAPGGAAAWLAFVFLLGPVLGPIQAGPHFAADRYTYLAALPFSALAAGLLLDWMRRRGPRLPGLAAGLGVAVLAALSVVQSRVWADSISLWSQAIRVDASSYIAFANRASGLASEGRFEEALRDFNEAVRLHPKSPKPLSNRAGALAELRRFQEAMSDVDAAIRLDAVYTHAWTIRGRIQVDLGRPQDAVLDYGKALDCDRNEVRAWAGRAFARYLLRDLDGAAKDASAALVLNPFHTEALNTRALVRGETGDFEGAAADYDRALAVNPRVPETWAARGMVRAQQGRWGEAVRDIERALSVAPPGWPLRADTERRLREARTRARLR